MGLNGFLRPFLVQVIPRLGIYLYSRGEEGVSSRWLRHACHGHLEWHTFWITSLLFYDTIPEEMWANIYSWQIETWQTKHIYWCYLQKQKSPKDYCIIKVQPQTGDSSWKLQTWNTLQSLQAAWQVGEHLFQVAQLVVCGLSLFQAGKPYPGNLFESSLGNWACLKVSLHSYCL